MEAALLLKANWEIWMAYDLEGSYEEAPQTMLENAQRAGVARSDIDGSDLMLLVGGMCTGPALVKAQGERLLAMVLDGLHVSD